LEKPVPDLRLIVEGVELSIPKDMVGAAAAAFACQRLGMTDPELRLRRKSGEGFVGDAVVIGSVLHDGDELELVPRVP
jgi:hypothetical protein